MCNLYKVTKSASEIARLFRVIDATGGANYGELVFPGYPGLVVAEGKLRVMNWGFPLVLKGKQGQPLKPKPVNNCRTDKLSSAFWRASFEHRRCLIPVTSFAEAEGANRMPVILKPDMYEAWLDGASTSAAELCCPFGGGMVIDRTSEPWVKR